MVRPTRRGHPPLLIALVVLVVRLAFDLITLVLRTVLWLLEHMCQLLERCTAALRPTETPTVLSRSETPAVLRQPKPLIAVPPVKIDTDVDKLARLLANGKKPDAQVIAQARELLARGTRVPT